MIFTQGEMLNPPLFKNENEKTKNRVITQIKKVYL